MKTAVKDPDRKQKKRKWIWLLLLFVPSPFACMPGMDAGGIDFLLSQQSAIGADEIMSCDLLSAWTGNDIPAGDPRALRCQTPERHQEEVAPPELPAIQNLN